MIAAVALLCAVLHCSAAVAAQCEPSQEVECFEPPHSLDAPGPVSIDVCAGKKLLISLKNFSEHPVCNWSRGADPKLTVNGSQSMVLSPLTKSDSGEYTLSCETTNETSSSVKVSLHVVANRPMKPRLTLTRLNLRLSSPYFSCVSEGCPKPVLKFPGTNKKVRVADKGISVSSSDFHDKGMMCCATNTEGQECSQLYDYDLDTNLMKSDEVSNVTVSPGDAVLLRCRIKMDLAPPPVWVYGGHPMNTSTLTCSHDVKKEICSKDDSHSGSQMSYLSIESANLNHTGTYTCSSIKNTTKSVYIHVQAESFLSAQLEKSIIMSAEAASSSCLQANVSYHPVLHNCSWETPDKTLTKCIREENVIKHKTVKFCDPLKSGDYKLYMETAKNKETKTVSVCVVEIPKFKFRVNEDNSTFTIETVSLVPANYTWMSASATNDSNQDNLTWKEIPDASQTDSDISCTKFIKSSMSRDLLEGQYLRFCLTNSVGSWCDDQHLVYSHKSEASTGAQNMDDSLMMLKVGSLILLLALTVVTVVLIYLVKNKKPKYQPQLQMIQMVGPNDNDYIYINFKDFEYNPKWEFPRENLELGKELGSGAFGMVVQATAYGINKPGVSQQVAVKMLKDKHQRVEKEALMSELKMLTHIGQHANIVNLLGACTDSGPTYLIFQYCHYGDLLNYLKKNRELYHKSVTDAFNKDRFNSLYHNLQPRKSLSEVDTAVNNYMPMYPATTRGQEDIALITLCSDTEAAEGPEIYDEPDDQIEDPQTLTFDDLLSFAFQVAKGMEFLSAKNCIHRDLAARNVLVTKGRLVKIGDFGLARDIDNDSNYVVRGNVRLPVKWMAPESTFQGIYTMKSDVWAYGILLWEIFSLGVTPYPGMKVDHTFYSMIERGFKMECPYYADETVYEMMCKCWALNPCDRPSFSKLVSFMCDQLTDREEKLYHNMLDKTSTDYQNAPTILDISAMAQQNETKTASANEYSRTFSADEHKFEACDAEAAEENLLKPPDTE